MSHCMLIFSGKNFHQKCVIIGLEYKRKVDDVGFHFRNKELDNIGYNNFYKSNKKLDIWLESLFCIQFSIFFTNFVEFRCNYPNINLKLELIKFKFAIW